MAERRRRSRCAGTGSRPQRSQPRDHQPSSLPVLTDRLTSISRHRAGPFLNKACLLYFLTSHDQHCRLAVDTRKAFGARPPKSCSMAQSVLPLASSMFALHALPQVLDISRSLFNQSTLVNQNCIIDLLGLLDSIGFECLSQSRENSAQLLKLNQR